MTEKRFLFAHFIKKSAYSSVILLAVGIIVLLSAFAFFREEKKTEALSENAADYSEEITKAREYLDLLVSESEKSDAPISIYEDIYKAKTELNYFVFAREMSLDVWNYKFISDALFDYSFLFTESEARELSDAENDEMKELSEILKTKSYPLYIEKCNRENENLPVSETEKKLLKEENLLKLMASPDGKSLDSSSVSAINEALSVKRAYFDSADEKEKTALEEKFRVLSYRIENSLIIRRGNFDAVRFSLTVFSVLSFLFLISAASAAVRGKGDKTVRFYLGFPFSAGNVLMLFILSAVLCGAAFAGIYGLFTFAAAKIFTPSLIIPYVFSESFIMPAFISLLAKFFLVFLQSLAFFGIFLFIGIFAGKTAGIVSSSFIFALSFSSAFIPALRTKSFICLFSPARAAFPYDFGENEIVFSSLSALFFAFILIIMLFAAAVLLFRNKQK